MYKRILAALDGSRCARLALDEALKIASASDASVLAIYVIERPTGLVDVGSAFPEGPEPVTAAGRVADAALEEVQQLFEQHHVRGTVRAIDAYGEEIAQVLIRTATECEADLIVMGTSGRHGVRRVLLGSVAESVLRAADQPVLLVRYDPNEKEKAPTR